MHIDRKVTLTGADKRLNILLKPGTATLTATHTATHTEHTMQVGRHKYIYMRIYV